MPIGLYRKLRNNIREDGLLVSSSGFLVRNMIGRVDFSSPLRILEIGSGKGGFTRELVTRMTEGSILDVCEIKQEYNCWIEPLIAQYPQKKITLYNDCVTRLLTGQHEYDVILSSLPLKNFMCSADNNAFLNRIIEGIRTSLKEGGMYLQYQYFRSNKSDIERIFGQKMDSVSFVPLNILPAFVYSMTKRPVDLEQTEAALIEG